MEQILGQKEQKTMKVVVAIDSFKGSLSSLEAGNAAKAGILNAVPESEVIVCPLADGGEGTVNALVLGMGGHLETVAVTGPLGAPVDCTYGIIENSKTAIIEMAGAAGITLIPPEQRNPLFTTTYGVGEVIKDAILKGCRHFIIGIGGSATNDGGIGMLQALGFELSDQNGQPVPHGANGLKVLAKISDRNVLLELKDCRFRIACDVKNPLCGTTGASAVYGPQKGATPEMVSSMDGWLADFAIRSAEHFPHADPLYPGAGAAGGLGFAFLTFLNAQLESGIQIVLEEIGLENLVKDADYVVTGEGKLDLQTSFGKAPVGVAKIAKKFQKPVLAFAGAVTPEATACNERGIDAFFPILRTVQTLESAMEPENAAYNMQATAEQAFRLIQACKSSGSL